MLQFKNASLNDRFEILTEKDLELSLPDGYTGPLTGIKKEETLDNMIARKSKLVARKQVVVPQTPEPETPQQPVKTADDERVPYHQLDAE